MGYGLINIVDADQNGDLLERISNIRKQFALDLGIIVPSLRIQRQSRTQTRRLSDPSQRRTNRPRLAHGWKSPRHGSGKCQSNPVPGIPTKEPAFGLDAIWITPRQKEEATYAGYTVVDLSTVIATHVTELIRQNASELLGRQELQTLIDSFKTIAPKVVEDLIPALLPLGTVLKVCSNLLKGSGPDSGIYGRF